MKLEEERRRMMAEQREREEKKRKEELKTRVKILVDEGSRASDQGDYAVAVAKWEEARMLSPSEHGLDAAIGVARRRLAEEEARLEHLRAEEERRKREVAAAQEQGMVLIPAGYFMMGSNDSDDQKPPYRVWVDAFYIDKYEITNRQYGEFMKATGYSKPAYWDNGRFNAPDQPVVGVSWKDAAAYCKWAGKRLPTEAEWEKAARGGLEGKRYPWGDESPEGKANYSDAGIQKPTEVGKYAANGNGLYDMAGNAWEWCADWYDDNYYKNAPERNPWGPGSGEYRVLRGGSWNVNHRSLALCAP